MGQVPNTAFFVIQYYGIGLRDVSNKKSDGEVDQMEKIDENVDDSLQELLGPRNGVTWKSVYSDSSMEDIDSESTKSLSQILQRESIYADSDNDEFAQWQLWLLLSVSWVDFNNWGLASSLIPFAVLNSASRHASTNMEN